MVGIEFPRILVPGTVPTLPTGPGQNHEDTRVYSYNGGVIQGLSWASNPLFE